MATMPVVLASRRARNHLEAGDIGKAHVARDRVERLFARLDHRERRLAIFGHHATTLVAGKQGADRARKLRVVLDHQNAQIADIRGRSFVVHLPFTVGSRQAAR